MNKITWFSSSSFLSSRLPLPPPHRSSNLAHYSYKHAHTRFVHHRSHMSNFHKKFAVQSYFIFNVFCSHIFRATQWSFSCIINAACRHAVLCIIYNTVRVYINNTVYTSTSGLMSLLRHFLVRYFNFIFKNPQWFVQVGKPFTLTCDLFRSHRAPPPP